MKVYGEFFINESIVSKVSLLRFEYVVLVIIEFNDLNIYMFDEMMSFLMVYEDWFSKVNEKIEERVF